MASTLLVLKIWYIYNLSHHTILTPIRRCVLDTTLCNKVCHWLTTDMWFPPTKKTDRHDITEILLTVALTTTTQTPTMFNIVHWGLKLNRYHKHQIQIQLRFCSWSWEYILVFFIAAGHLGSNTIDHRVFIHASLEIF